MPAARVVVLAALLAAACSDSGGNMPPPKDPPQVFIIAPEVNQYGPSLRVSVNVSGCEAVKQVQILNGTKFLFAVTAPTKLPVVMDLPPSVFNSLYQSLGIAVHLTLKAKAICDDERFNTSSPIPVNFFPAEKVTGPAEGNSIALPDVFVAEGGAGGAPTFFVGCVATDTGVRLARFDTDANVISTTVPLGDVPCSYDTYITERNKGAGIRWALEFGKGLFAFDSTPGTNLNLKAVVKSEGYKNLGVGPDGDALVFDIKALMGVGASNLLRLSRAGGGVVWGAEATGIMVSTPVVSQNEVVVVMWSGSLGTYSGSMMVQKFRYDTGAFISERTFAAIEYGELNTPVLPPATVSTDGKFAFFAFQTNGMRSISNVIACAVDAAPTAGCGPAGGAKWISPDFPEVIQVAVPFANDTLVAAIGADAVYFLSAATGQIVNVFGRAVKPGENLTVKTVTPGMGNDFYVMSGPDFANVPSYPTEIIAVDSPEKGEIWRAQLEGGDTPTNALYVAVDEGGNAWLRVGAKQVKPLTLNQYRMVKGSNLEPMP